MNPVLLSVVFVISLQKDSEIAAILIASKPLIWAPTDLEKFLMNMYVCSALSNFKSILILLTTMCQFTIPWIWNFTEWTITSYKEQIMSNQQLAGLL